MIPDDVVEVMSIINSSGGVSYLVGGSVRDILLGYNPHDYDIATNKTPHQILSLFSSRGFKVIPKGIEYGVVSIITPAKREVEIATFRKEVYMEKYNRKSAKVEFSSSLKEDILRRDFTINGLAMDINGFIYDYVGGIRDLYNKTVRFIGDPSKRIREDPLRTLRALRLASKLGFQVDTYSFNEIRRNSKLIHYVSVERVRDEFRRAGETRGFHRFISLAYESDVLLEVIPELEDHNIHVITKALTRMDNITSSYLVKIAGLLHPLEHNTAFNVLRRLKFTRKERRIVLFLLKNKDSVTFTKEKLANLSYIVKKYSNIVNVEPTVLARFYFDFLEGLYNIDLRGERRLVEKYISKPIPKVSWNELKRLPRWKRGLYVKEKYMKYVLNG